MGVWPSPVWLALHFKDLQILWARLQDRYAFRIVNALLSALWGVFRACWQLGQMDSKTYMHFRDIKPVCGHRMPTGRMLERRELADLLDACRCDPRPIGARDQAAFALMACTGLRRREVSTLSIAAVDFDRHTVRVVGKGSKERRVPLPPFIVVRDWLPELWEQGQAVLDAPISASGQVLADALQWHCGQAGIARCTPHDLRRTCISNLRAAGVDPFLVQRLAGHADPATTALYDRRRDAVDRMPDPTDRPVVPRSFHGVGTTPQRCRRRRRWEVCRSVC